MPLKMAILTEIMKVIGLKREKSVIKKKLLITQVVISLSVNETDGSITNTCSNQACMCQAVTLNK